MADFTSKDIDQALKNVKNGKAAGAYGVLPEFLKNLGPKGKSWFAKLASKIVKTSILPKIWHEAKVIAILKPNKSANEPHNYRPISLLSTAYKLFEKLLLARIEPFIDNILPVEQAEFRKNRSCCDQVLAFTTYVENGYQSKV